MHECYAMQILENKKKQTPKNNGHKENSNEGQEPCQKENSNQVFCIQNLLDVLRALEFEFMLE